MIRLIVITSALAFASIGSAFAATLCKSSPEVMDKCFVVHGRLFVANGTPNIRIWRVGTKRILGVFNGAGEAESDSLLPVSVEKALQPDPFQTEIYGNYEVCPLGQDRAGRMRPVCIEQARDLFVRHR